MVTPEAQVGERGGGGFVSRGTRGVTRVQGEGNISTSRNTQLYYPVQRLSLHIFVTHITSFHIPSHTHAYAQNTAASPEVLV
jgi:hypothetical protein